VTQNYFELFALAPTFNLDLVTLETNYRTIQSTSHPDRFVGATATEKLSSMQLATMANEAYQTLKNPAKRAKYLLELQNINSISETNTAMPADFLMQQMEWRENMEEAKSNKDIASLEQLHHQIQVEAKILQASLIDCLDIKKDYSSGTDVTRKLIFLDKVCDDINKIIEQLDS